MNDYKARKVWGLMNPHEQKSLRTHRAWTPARAMYNRLLDQYTHDPERTYYDQQTEAENRSWSTLTGAEREYVRERYLPVDKFPEWDAAIKKYDMAVEREIHMLPCANYIIFHYERKSMDYNWFPIWPIERFLMQDRIVIEMISGKLPNKLLLAVFTAGSYGSGKTHNLNSVLSKQFNTAALVRIDPDEIRQQLPEWEASHSVEKTHHEATFIALLAERVCIRMSLSYLVDGSLVNAEWYRTWLKEVAACGYFITLIRFDCSLDVSVARCAKRELVTGRHVKTAVIERVKAQIPESWDELKLLSRMWWIYDTTEELTLVDYRLVI